MRQVQKLRWAPERDGDRSCRGENDGTQPFYVTVRHPGRGPGDAHGGHDATTVVAHRRADAAQALFYLLVVDGVATSPHFGEIGLERAEIGDGPVCEAGHPAARHDARDVD